MPAHHEEHGGACCGRYHIYNFNPYDMPANLSSIKNFMDKDNNSYGDDGYEHGDDRQRSGMCCEVTLTEVQCGLSYRGKTFKTYLKDMGFEDVYQFLNPNSGNIVHVFLHSSNKVHL